MIKIRSACLVGIDIWRVKDAKIPFAVERIEKERDEAIDLAHPTYLMSAVGKIYGEGRLISFIDKDFPISSRMIYRREHSVPSFWTDKITAIYLDSGSNTDYLMWKAFIRLVPEAVSNLVSLEYFESERMINELFATVFPRCTGEHVDFNKYSPSYSHVLYIEPETDYSKNYPDFSNLAADIIAQFNAGGAPQPHFLFDVLLIHSIGAGTPSKRIAAIGINPLDIDVQRTDLVYLPKTVLDILAYYGYSSELWHAHKRLVQLPFYERSFKDYVLELKQKGSLRSIHHAKFLMDREQEISTRLRTTQTLDEIHRELANNYVSKYGDDFVFSKSIKTNTSARYVYDVFNDFRDILPEAERAVREAIEIVHQRADALADFLRDSSTADATKSNISLQQRILWFTIIIALATIAVIIMDFLSDIP